MIATSGSITKPENVISKAFSVRLNPATPEQRRLLDDVRSDFRRACKDCMDYWTSHRHVFDYGSKEALAARIETQYSLSTLQSRQAIAIGVQVAMSANPGSQPSLPERTPIAFFCNKIAFTDKLAFVSISLQGVRHKYRYTMLGITDRKERDGWPRDVAFLDLQQNDFFLHAPINR